MNFILALIILLVCITVYVLVLVKSPPVVRVVVALIVTVGVAKVAWEWSSARERNEIWNRSARPLGDILGIAQYHIREGQSEKADAIISHLNEGGLVFGTFFGRTNYPSYEALEAPLQPDPFTVQDQ